MVVHCFCRALHHKASYSVRVLTATRMLHFLSKSKVLTGYQYFFTICLSYTFAVFETEKQFYITHFFNLSKAILQMYFKVILFL